MFNYLWEKKYLATFTFFLISILTYILSKFNFDSIETWGTKNSILALSFLYPPLLYFLFYEKLIGKIPLNLQSLYHLFPFFIFTILKNFFHWDFNDTNLPIQDSFVVNENLNQLSTLYLIKEIQLDTYLFIDAALVFSLPPIQKLLNKYFKNLHIIVLIYCGLLIRIALNSIFFKTFFFIDIHFNLLFVTLLYFFTFFVILVIKVSIGKYELKPKFADNTNNPLPKSLEVLIKEYKIEEENNSLDPKVIIELSKEILEEIQIKLEIYLESKPTRDLKFNKIYLVKELEIPEYLINLYFKKYLKISFKNWKTEVRIRDSNSLIEDGFLISHTVDALAHEVGFLSRSRFVQAFQKINKCPPSQYLKNSD